MKLILILVTICMFLNMANTQEIFDYQRFLIVFGLKFDYERFVQTFFPNSNIVGAEGEATPFSYDDFVNTFFGAQGVNQQEFDYETFVKTFNLADNKNGASDQEFDFENFKKVFNLECKG